MTPYHWAWLAIAVAAPLTVAFLNLATWRWRMPRTRLVVNLLLLVWLLAPAPVPAHAGSYAPAFIVLVFEWLFQKPGDPGTAGLILGAVTAAALGLGLILMVLRRSRPGAASDPA